MFALQRFRFLNVLEEKFIRKEFDVDKYMGDSLFKERGEQLYEVKLRFSARRVPYIKERIWHPSQKIQIQSNGEILTLEVTGLDSIKR